MSSPQPAQTTPRRYQLFIDGQFVDAESGKTFKSPNPSTGETFAEVAEADQADVDKAVAAARKATTGKWSKMSARDRGRLLYKLSQLIERDAAQLAELETRDNGKPIKESTYIDLPGVVENFEYFAGWPTKIEGETIPVPGQMFNYTLREPVGVCGQIIPWNFPLLMAAWKPEQTPVTAIELAKLIQEAGFPEGVVNIIPGFGETAGAALASHKGIDKIAFTGSTEVGKLIAKAAAGNLTKVSLELGGKAPNIIFADADLEQAVNGAMMGIFFNQGQVCCAGSRIFVEEKARDEFLARFKEKADRIKVGDPMDKATLMGPQVSGPVSSVITFKDDDELIQKANDTIYGLSAGIWTQNLTRAHRFAKAIKAGVVWINTYNMMNAASPFGGYKQSGYGREMGKHALELYTQVKSVWVDLSGKPIGWFGK